VNSFEYVVYYEYNGPSTCDPLRSLKDSDEISRALRDLPSALQHCLRSDDTVHESKSRDGDSITVQINTTLCETVVDDAVRHCLKALDLFGRKLKQD